MSAAKFGGTPKKGFTKRDGCFENATPMKRDRGYETAPADKKSLRGTDSPVQK